MYDQIKDEIDKIRRKYLDSAEEIVSGYNRECGLSKDYEGRQMFELLQNADDEAKGSSGKVQIRFDGKTLSVSNTGKPFSFRGIKSLLYPNASPKKIHANKIGCKGLGFRAILTWSNAVTVASKDFTIRFSKEYAKKFLQSILDEKTELREEMAALSGDPWPIATLACPDLSGDNALIDGFSTSIIMECREDLADIIEGQIVNLEFEELVFLPNLKEIEIVCNGYHKVFYKVSEGNDVIIETCDKNTNETECASWRLYKKTGSVKDENGDDKDYEFIIAYDSTEERRGEVLYSYFKTDVKLGFPALIHGTFELTSDRNSLQKKSRVNEQLIPLLADFMVQTAVDISEEQKECDYRPLSLVITSDMDIVLKNVYKLDELLKEKVYKKKILPTIANVYISINDNPRYSEELFADVLNPKVFSTLLKSLDNDFYKKYIKSDLNIDFYDYVEFCHLLNKDIEYYTLFDKVKLIALINREYRDERGRIFPHLIEDNDGRSICDYATVYPIPVEDQVIALPEWVEIRFLNQEMEHTLYKNLGLSYNNRRNLATALSRYNLEEYSFDRLLRGVVNQVDENMASVDKCSDILNWLWNYYNLKERHDISDFNVKVICRDGSIHSAKECYIGSEYGNELGERIVGLYSNYFVAFEALHIDCEDKNTVVGFLEWIGVSKYPRLVKKNLVGEERSRFLNICYPLYVQTDNRWYNNREFQNIKEVSVGFFENFETILEKAAFNDLLAWFILDNEIGSRINSETEERNSFAYISGWPGLKQNERRVAPVYIKSYLRHYLSETKWLPDENGLKEVPEYCCFGENSFAPFILAPKIEYAYINEIVGRNCRKEVDAVLSRIGVSDDFQEMNNVVVYQMLMKLPELDPECKKARGLYRKIIRYGHSPEEYKKNNPAYDEFKKNGMVAARQGETKRYVPISEARYADKRVFSNEILKSFNMFDIDARSGEDKIKKLFGVNPLEYTNIEVNGVPEIHPLNEAFKKEYMCFIPYVFACRMTLKHASADFRRLKSSKIILCSKISIKCKDGDEEKNSVLNDYETVYLRESSPSYICVPKKVNTFSELRQSFDFADAVAELITAILDVNEDKDFFRDLFREEDSVREKKMRLDKGDENLELLIEARKRFNFEIDLRDEFWMIIAEVLHVSDIEITSSPADKLIAALCLKEGVDAGVKYEDLSSYESIKALIPIFSALGIDIDKYNAAAVHTIDVTKYWTDKLRIKMKNYLPKYQAYLIDKLKNDERCAELYDKYKEEYIYLEPAVKNSLFVDIDKLFEDECDVGFAVLDGYSSEAVFDLIKKEELKLSRDKYEKLQCRYSKSKIEAYLVFGRIEELCSPQEEIVPEQNSEPSQEQVFRGLAEKVLSMPSDGFSKVSTQSANSKVGQDASGKQRKHHRKIYNESSDKKKQEIGLVGEAYVFKELKELYPDAIWVSGNAEKAGHSIEGDDTCGYDIKYIDEYGGIQYVEVKASRNEDIAFSLSDSELRFGCQNAARYEIIYVVIGEDGMPLHKPWRLGHLFEFAEGEDIMHNNKFSIQSDGYSITAKPVRL